MWPLFPLQTFLGIDSEIALLITVVVATIGTFGSMALILFFTFAPHVSEKWRAEFGTALARVGPSDRD